MFYCCSKKSRKNSDSNSPTSPTSKYTLAPKQEEREEVVSTSKKEYSDEFKDLVLSMLSYHFYDRPSI